jgi:transcription antitermination factor NusG
MAFWAVARTEPHREATAARFLGAQDFETYLPVIQTPPPRGQTIRRTAPLFPGYIFILIRLQWYSIKPTFGVRGLIMDGTVPARLADSVIDEIRQRESGGFVKLPAPSRFRRGQKVRIVRGAFDGQCGLYDGQASGERERVLLSLLGQKDIVVQFPRLSVVACYDPD